MMFKQPFHQAIVAGKCTLTFRYWKKPQARAGGVYKVYPIGLIRVNAVQTCQPDEISERDATQSGFESRRELLAYLQPFQSPGATLYRVGFEYTGPDERPAPSRNTDWSDREVRILTEKLDRKDRGKKGPWTRDTLRIIDKHPNVSATRLAGMLQRQDVPSFKADVRKLKQLGLTESLEVGYRISPRGQEFLKRARLISSRDS